MPIAAAILFASLIDLLIAQAALRFTHVPSGFPPFTLLPILSGTVGGPLLAAVVYAIVRATSAQPTKTFLFVAVLALAASFALPCA